MKFLKIKKRDRAFIKYKPIHPIHDGENLLEIRNFPVYIQLHTSGYITIRSSRSSFVGRITNEHRCGNAPLKHHRFLVITAA